MESFNDATILPLTLPAPWSLDSGAGGASRTPIFQPCLSLPNGPLIVTHNARPIRRYPGIGHVRRASIERGPMGFRSKRRHLL